MGEEVIRGDEVDVVDAMQFDHFDHPAEEFFRIHSHAQTFMGNLIAKIPTNATPLSFSRLIMERLLLIW